MKIKFRGKEIETNEWVCGYYHKDDRYSIPYHWIRLLDSSRTVEVIAESVGQVIEYDKKEYNQFDYNVDGEMLIFCNSCMGWQFAQIDIPTKDVCIDCHNCDGNFMFHDAIHKFQPIANFVDTIT